MCVYKNKNRSYLKDLNWENNFNTNTSANVIKKKSSHF